ncbi:LytTR family transcriptional regulator DNA-binding domain-containing protein [Flagellimonas sp. W118]|uniref:LytTR family transcriptional regulator DNA-binding domain-containing protein n=1 Tax=Flagellimonas sp. W118 TaxID=3410791 RepID=UPI003BF5D786
MTYHKKINYWRILEPILLGSVTNIVVNFIFDPVNPDFILEEFLVAVVFATILTEINRLIDKKLDKKISWANNLGKRFLHQLIYLTGTLLILLNVIGNIYTWLVDNDFYSLKELMIINLCLFVVALLFTFFKWSMHFYKSWIHAEQNLETTHEHLNELKSEFDKKNTRIELLKGNSMLQINASDINFVKAELGVVWVYYDMEKAVFPNTLTNLMGQLPKHLFFLATRNAIIHRDRIMSISPSTYGKIDLTVKNSLEENNSITISRLKAASFRKWYNSSSS